MLNEKQMAIIPSVVEPQENKSVVFLPLISLIL